MNIQKFIAAAIANNGASFNLNTAQLNPSKGYFVSIADAELKVDAITPEIVKTYINDNIDLLAIDGVFLGAWFNSDDSKWYLDSSTQIESLREALTKGMRRDQKAIFDANVGREIKLPSRQKCGTEHQKKSYIDMTVDELIKTL